MVYSQNDKRPLNVLADLRALALVALCEGGMDRNVISFLCPNYTLKVVFEQVSIP